MENSTVNRHALSSSWIYNLHPDKESSSSSAVAEIPLMNIENNNIQAARQRKYLKISDFLFGARKDDHTRKSIK